MKVDSVLHGSTFASLRAAVADAEAAGFDGLWSAELAGDPFVPLTVAAEHSEHIELGTAITVGFARSPMTVAYTAHDLQRLSGGRFVLGLGSQVRAHIERRFSMPWGQPARRMHEYVRALHAIWDAWAGTAPLRFEGEFYRHTLMTPMFTPEPAERPAVYLAAVGPAMTEVAGEVCDGLLVHPFSTPRYLDDQLLPALDRGAARAGRRAADLTVSLPCFVATGFDAEAVETARDRIRARLAFYGSTPAYRGVLEAHGWGELGDRLHAESRNSDAARWTRMAKLVTDDVVDVFAVSGPPSDIAPQLLERYAGRVDRLTLACPPEVDAATWNTVLEDVRAG